MQISPKLRRLCGWSVVLTCLAARAWAQAPVEYKVSFPEPEHHWLQVDVTFPQIGAGPLQARMSRSSPGRYAVHEFAKNVFWVEAYDGRGRQLAFTRPNVDEWDVAGHDGTVRLVYKIFGDRVDGTYLAVDTTHAHLNMPATFMWAVGLEGRPLRMTFTPPAAVQWKVATQLFPTRDPWTFTAPNLQYFMDSPTELSNFVMSTFSVPNSNGTPANFRVVAHSDGTQADVDDLAGMIRRLVQEHLAVYGEFPSYEPGAYTFLLDYVPWGGGDGMEHRNSTSISSTGVSLRTPEGRRGALGTISHEFFHNWNVERIRPVGLEPFDFTRENITCCLWLAEGFTRYYGPLLLRRAGLSQTVPVNNAIAVIDGSGRQVRSAVQMSEHAAFADAGVSIDVNDRSRTFISYYTYGAAIALALDLSLRERSGGRLSLDDYMRRLWTEHGKPGGAAPGLVAKPYSLKDLRAHLAVLTGDQAFADEFFDKYIEGREVPDYARLLDLAGYALRGADGARGWTGIPAAALQEGNGGLMIGASGRGGGRGGGGLVDFGTPAYDAGLDAGDVIVSIDGTPATAAGWNALSQKPPRTPVSLVVRRRDGATVTRTLQLGSDPSLRIDDLGPAMSAAQRTFRDGWLGTRVR
jgi:predicted metalloprotease with PDZ domain